MKPLKNRNWSGRILSLIPPAITGVTLTILPIIGIAGTCLGQGTVNWQTISTAAITAQTNTQQYSPIFGGGSTGGGVIGNTAPASSGLVYYYELLYNTNFTGFQAPIPDWAALLGTWRDTGLMATNNNALGGGRLVPVNPNFAAVVPWDNGTTNNIMLVGWSANLGASWPAVSNKLAHWADYSSIVIGEAFFGESATGYLTPQASGTAPGTAVFAVAPTTYGLPIYSPNMQLYLLPNLETGGGGVTNAPGGGGVVTNCTEVALRAAMAGGGPVTFACDGTITLTSTITNSVNTTLDGTGHQITISGGNQARVFYVGNNNTLALVNLTITNGNSTGGGAIRIQSGTVCATNCTFTGNQVVLNYPSQGGAILNDGGCLNLQNCIFTNNWAAGKASGGSGFGGAIFNTGSLIMDNCRFVRNWASGGDGYNGIYNGPGGNGGAAWGGAIYNLGSLVINRSTFTSNSVGGGSGGDGGIPHNPPDTGGKGGDGGDAWGGAIYSAGSLLMQNSTVAANTTRAGYGGFPGGYGASGGKRGSPWGAISAGGTLVNVTVVLNTGDSFGGGSAVVGISGCSLINCTVASNSASGRYGTGSTVGGCTMVSLANTLLAGNSPSNCSGTITDGGHNLSSDASFTFTNVGSMNNTDPKLGPLADNGGPTLTMALLPGSPAIDGGTAIGAPATDQRGVPRPQGAGVDIGAFEYLTSPTFTGTIMLNATTRQMQFCGLSPNQTLTLQVSTNLLNWWDATNFTAGPNGAFQCLDPIPGDTHARYYRLKSGTP